MHKTNFLIVFFTVQTNGEKKKKKSIVSPQSQELIELLGIETALRLFRKLGGINIEMGKKLEVCDYAL